MPCELQKTLRARQETIDKWFKNFSVLSSRFRRKVELHSFCFRSAANLTYLLIQSELSGSSFSAEME